MLSPFKKTHIDSPWIKLFKGEKYMRKYWNCWFKFFYILKMSMYSLFYHSNIRLHISIINNFFFSVRGCDTTFSQFRISLTSFFFFIEFTHCYMLSASLALSHWKLLLKKVHNDVSIYITHSVLYCVQKKVEKKKNLSSYLVFINISSVQYETCFLWIVYYILYIYCDISRCPLTLEKCYIKNNF